MEKVNFFSSFTHASYASLQLLLSVFLFPPSVVFQFVYHQHLPLSLGSLDSGWPGTTPVYSYFLSIIINIVHPHSQKCLVWVINYLVLLFISDLDLQPYKYSNSPILRVCNRHTHSESNALFCISLSFPLQSHLLKLLFRSAFSISFPIIVLSTSGLQPFWHQGLVLWQCFHGLTKGMLWGWFKHVIFIVYFISIIITSTSFQIIRH